ncbi:hypothetical protein N7470_004353 [Penicillium chermesinum]|nr:hypothetical protein N7470_004353 [Penicillium chermesinum]
MSFGGFGTSNMSGAGTSAELGPQLSDVFTDEVGFKGLSGDANIRFLPTPWPKDSLPAPTSSLLAVAQTQGLVVGAGPDSLVVAPADSVRKAIEAPAGDDQSKTKAFQPQATIAIPARPTHIAFTADDSALILATENGSQISVFQTTSLSQNNAQPAFCLVTVNGELLVADLKAGNLLSGANGPVLRNGVSSVAWSNKGKQLLAGLADGSGDQMTPDGTRKDQIPRPSDLEGEYHVSSVAWLENDVFFMVYTPNTLEDDMGQNPESFYYIITRRKGSPFLIQRLPGICSTMGFEMKRSPAYNFIVRLRDYKPHLKDVLMVASTASTDVGLITRSEQPLADDETSKGLAGQFTTTEVNDDGKRASIPLKDLDEETSVIGLAADLSCSETVLSPILGADISESATPLPGLFLLNNEGVLSAWWFIYSEAIRQKVPYVGLSSVPSSQATAPAAPAAPAQQTPAFGQPAFGSSTSSQTAPALGAPASQPAFGKSSFGSPSPFGASAFGKPAGGGAAFGSPSTMGATAFGKPSSPGSFGSPGAVPAFGKPSFGTPSTPAQPKFGASGFGTAASPFGNPGNPNPTKSLLGSGGFAAAAKPGESPFAKKSSGPPSGEASTGSPFANSGASAFAKAGSSTTFGASTESKTAFMPSNSTQVKNPFGGGGSNGFVLGSTFKPDGTAASDEPKSDKPSSGSFSFGLSVDDMVSSPNKTSPAPDAMDDMEDADKPAEGSAKTEPTSIFGNSKLLANDTPVNPFAKANTPPGKSLFGSQDTDVSKTPSTESTKSPLSLFGNNASTSATSQASSTQNQVTSPASIPSDKTATPMRETSTPTFSSFLDAPLPPDPTSRDSYAPGDTSASSNVSKSSVEDAPLPPDFTFSKKETKPGGLVPPPDSSSQKKPTPKADNASPPPEFIDEKPASEPEDAPLPPDFMSKPKKESSPSAPTKEASLLPEAPSSEAKTVPAEEAAPLPDGSDADSENDSHESDFSDSGEEITHDETNVPSPKLSESSFAGLSDKGSGGGIFGGFSKPAAKQAQPPRQLFGEIPKQPLLPPPGPVAQNGQGPFFGRPEKSKEAAAAGTALTARKASLSQLAQRNGQLRKPQDADQDHARLHQAAQQRRDEEEALSLSDDDEDERLRADLARPIEPVSTLDPFLPHQSYTGDTTKPGIPGMVERMYRDINAMIDTLGINARSLESFLLHEQPPQPSDPGNWIKILESEQPTDLLDEKFTLQDISNLDEIFAALTVALEKGRVQGVEEKLEQGRELLTKDIVALRGQCASIRKTLDTYTDSAAILVAPLPSEHAALQQELRTEFTRIQGRLAEAEEGVSLLRAKIADIPRTDGDASRHSMKRPTVEAVASTISTMMSMAERKSSDIDVLEAQMRKLGVDTTSPAPASREGSPFTTPRKNGVRFPTTPGSRSSIDGSAYHTPDSASRALNFRNSINGSAKTTRLRSVEGASSIIALKRPHSGTSRLNVGDVSWAA